MNLELISRHPAGEARPTPLLFVHGAWHGAWCWEEHFLAYFAGLGYEAHALSLRGHGKSGGTYRYAGIRHYVEDVQHVAHTLRTLPILIGHSLGGYVVQKYLERHDAPAAVLLASLPTSGDLAALIRASIRQPGDAVRATLRFDVHSFVDTPPKARHYLFGDDMPEGDVNRYTARLQGESYRVLVDAALFALPRPTRVKCPVLVIGAEKDTVFTLTEIHATARNHGTSAHIIPGAAHDLMLDARWQQCADVMAQWLHAQNH